MSLQVWLPLNGNLNNQGLSNVIVTNHGATVNDSGKIGKCYSFNGSNSKLHSSCDLVSMFNTRNWSVSFWFNASVLPNSSNPSDWKRLIIYRKANISDAASKQLVVYLTKTGIGTSFFGNDTETAISGLAVNTWYHVVLTQNGAISTTYINGTLLGTASKSNLSIPDGSYLQIGYDSDRQMGAFNGKLNDVRIYDHCLSPKEVKEIAKGLVLHYKLDDAYAENTINLGGTSVNYSNKVYGNTYTAGSWGGDAGTVTFYSSGGYNNGPYKVYHKTTTGSGGIYLKTANDITIVSGKTYTMSIYVKASIDYTDSNYSFNINGFTANDSGHYITFSTRVHFTTEWQRISRTFTATDSDAGTYGEMSIIYNDNVTDYYVYFSCFQIEEKDHATPFVIGERTQNIVYDSSGYNNHGTIIGSLSINSDSPRYNKCIYISDGRTNYIYSNIIAPKEQCTMCLWIKGNTKGYSNYHIPYSISSNNYEFLLKGDNGLFRQGFVINGTRYCTTTSTPTIDNKWHHLAATFDGTSIKRYVDGIKISEESHPGTLTGGSLRLYIGNYAGNTYGSQKLYSSDVRLYTTALSDDDIKELYNTAAFIDNSHNMHCYEFVENDESTPKIEKTGLVKSNEFNEYPDDYIFYDYIQSSGTQWIDSGVKANQDTVVEIEFEITGNETGYGAVFGARTNASSNCFNVWTKCGNGKIGCQVGNSGNKNCNTTQAANVIYKLKTSNGNITVNGDSVDFTPVSNFETPLNVRIFDIANGNTSSSGTSNRILIGKVYSFKLYESNIIIRNMFPAKRKSDNAIGMYDMVTGRFFGNSGTGTFTTGTPIDVAAMYENKIDLNQLLEI